jgi:hypothetical protein
MAKAAEQTETIVELGSPAHIETMNIHQRMLGIEMDAPAVAKTGTNESQGWKYMEHAEIVAALRPLFQKYRVKYYYTEISNSISPQEGWDKDAKAVVPRGAKSAKQVRHTFVNVDKPDEIVTGDTFSEANSTSDKASNAASTYAQKMYLLRTFNLTDHDPDAEAIEAAPLQPKAKISKSRETDIYTMLKRLDLTVEDYEKGLNHKYGIEKVTELTNAQAQAEIENMVAYITRQSVSATQATV